MIIAIFGSQQYTLYKEINSFLKIGFPSVKIELNIQVDHIYKCNLRAQRRFQFEGWVLRPWLLLPRSFLHAVSLDSWYSNEYWLLLSQESNHGVLIDGLQCKRAWSPPLYMSLPLATQNFFSSRLYLTPWCIARTRFFMSWASCMYVCRGSDFSQITK